MLAKRRKKDRGSTERLAELPRVTHSVCSGIGYNSSAKPGEYFGLFSLEKSFDGVEKKYSRGDTSRCSHKVHGIPAPATI